MGRSCPPAPVMLPMPIVVLAYRDLLESWPLPRVRAVLVGVVVFMSVLLVDDELDA
jgi:hypothetical protein